MSAVNKESRKKSSKNKEKNQQFWFSDLEYQIRSNLPADLPKRTFDIYLVTDIIQQQSERVEK